MGGEVATQLVEQRLMLGIQALVGLEVHRDPEGERLPHVDRGDVVRDFLLLVGLDHVVVGRRAVDGAVRQGLVDLRLRDRDGRGALCLQRRHEGAGRPDRHPLQIRERLDRLVARQELRGTRGVVAEVVQVEPVRLFDGRRMRRHQLVGRHHADPLVGQLNGIGGFVDDKPARCVDRHDGGHVGDPVRQALGGIASAQQRPAPNDVESQFPAGAFPQLFVQPLERAGARAAIGRKLGKAQHAHFGVRACPGRRSAQPANGDRNGQKARRYLPHARFLPLAIRSPDTPRIARMAAVIVNR